VCSFHISRAQTVRSLLLQRTREALLIEEEPRQRVRSLAPLAPPTQQQVSSDAPLGDVNEGLAHELIPSVRQVKQRQRRLLEKVRVLFISPELQHLAHSSYSTFDRHYLPHVLTPPFYAVTMQGP
jgi:hypothetical protein